jgi:cysteinyl-tRNA synthetase
MGLLNVEGTKMSKSLGNYVSLKDGLDRFGAELIVFVTMKHHYRSAIDFNNRLFHESLNNLCEYHLAFQALGVTGSEPAPASAVTQELDQAFDEAMAEDFNTPLALQTILQALRTALTQPPSAERTALAARARKLGQVLDLFRPERTLESVRTDSLRFQTNYLKRPALTPADIERLITERMDAHKAKDFKRSDTIRDELLASGVTLLDSAKGDTGWQFAVSAK